MSGDRAMAAEFDTVAEWTAEAVRVVGLDHAIPVGCRGSCNPGVLHWFLDRLDPAPGQIFLDSGAGVGGPAAFAVQEAHVRPVLTDPEIGACHAARSLFGLPAIQAGTALPITTGSVRAGWSLGVLCTVDDQSAYLAELHRVLHPRGRFGLLVYTRTHPGRLDHLQPDGNTFPTDSELAELLAGAMLRVDSSGRADEFAAVPSSWRASVSTVRTEIERRHGHDERWRTAEQQADLMGQLLASAEVVGTVLVVVPS